MIRLADYQDTKIAVELLQQFLQETSYRQAQQASENVEHLAKIVWAAQQYGYIWLGFIDEQPAGILIAMKEPNMWFPQARELRELVWYVHPNHRNTTLAGRLFHHYQRKGDELLAQGSIQGYFTTRMITTTGIDLERRGFRLTESTYIKE
jgi:hypothetical protein